MTSTHLDKQEQPRAEISSRFLGWVACWSALSGMGSALYFFISRGALWEDEIIAATHALQPFPHFFIEVLRNDIHPFVYFLGLKLWSLIDAGDTWLLSNSMLGSVFSIMLVAGITLRNHGHRAALYSTAWFCVLPNFAWASANLRMYSWLPGLVVLVWHLNRKAIRDGRAALLVALVLCQLLTAYVHAIEFFFLFFIAVSVLVGEWRQVQPVALRRWLIAQGLAAVLMLPLCASALLRGTEPLDSPSFASFVLIPLQLFSGWVLDRNAIALSASAALFLVLALLGIRAKSMRIDLICIPAAAIVVSILLGSLGKPMFKAPVFTANLVPFMCIAAGVGMAAASSHYIRWAGSGALALMSVATWPWAAAMHFPVETTEYRAAQFLRQHATSGDMVVIPNVSVFWGVMRYAVGAEWGRPLSVMPLQDKPMWAALKNRLGPAWVGHLGLQPKTDYVEHEGIRYVIGADVSHHVESPSRLWVLHKSSYQESVRLPGIYRNDEVVWVGNGISVSRLRPDPTGASVMTNPPRLDANKD